LNRGAAVEAIWLPFDHESQNPVDQIYSHAQPDFGLGFRGGCDLAIMRCFNGFGAKPCDGGGGCGQDNRGETGRASHRNTICCAHNFGYQSICAASHCNTICCTYNFGCQSIRNESARGSTIKRRNNRAFKHSNNCNINCSIKRRNNCATNCRNGCARKFFFAI
jgi:hypothetical protein